MRHSHARRFGCSLLLVVAGSLLTFGLTTGCETTSSRNKQAVVAPDPEADAFKALGYRLDWRGRGFVDKNHKPLFMVPMGDVLAYQDSASSLTIINADTGQIRWTTQSASALTKFVAPVRDGRVVRCSSETELYTLSLETGSLVGRESYEKVITTSPAVAGELYIYGTAIGELLAHIKGMGIKLWGFQTTGAIEQPPIMIGSTVGSVSQSGDVVFIDASSGSIVGRTRLFAGSTTAPVTDGSQLFVASTDQSLYAIDPDGGRVTWRIRAVAPLTVQPSVVDGVVYAELPERGLCAIDADSGQVRWEKPETRGTVICARAQNLIVWDGKNAALIDAGTGDTLESVTLPNVALLSTDGAKDPIIYVTDAKGRIGKFLPR